MFHFAIPKGRLLKSLRPLLDEAGLRPEPDFDDPACRRLIFDTEHKDVRLVRIRAFDVATFVASGVAAMGVAGSDVVEEHHDSELYRPVDLGVGRCRMIVAAPPELLKEEAASAWSLIRVATKYPNITLRHFADQGIQAEIIRLSGAIEIAPKLGLCRRIVDLVESGRTLEENGLTIVDEVMKVSAHLIVHRASLKNDPEIAPWIEKFRALVDPAAASPATVGTGAAINGNQTSGPTKKVEKKTHAHNLA